jgi:polyphenol oxidase
MEPFQQNFKTFYIIEEWVKEFPGLVAGFTTKHGGYSKEPFGTLNFGFHVGDEENSVCQNRNLLAQQIGFPLQQWIGAEQTHETMIQKVVKTDAGKGSESYESAFARTDGFLTSEKDILLTLCYADCVPLYFLAPRKQIIGIAHAGWKGSVNGIASEMITRLSQEGLDPSEIKVIVGPSICGNCYIVDETVIASIEKLLEPGEKKPYNHIYGNQYRLDLRELNKGILINAGVLAKNISTTEYCTSCHHELFFSHRKDNGKTGRMISFIGWKGTSILNEC